ncbi:Os03g0838450, partial [Oryza sativa Japonica Group]
MNDVPAAGVMQTRPVIMPWTAPTTEGFLKKMTSRHVQTMRLMAVQMLVLRTAMEATELAAYGPPPLNPAHPIHSNPAPVSVNSMLFGGNLSLSFYETGGTDPVGGGEAGDAGGDVDDVAAAVVDDAPVEEEAAAPEGEGADGVGEGEPERDEDHPGEEAHAAEEGAGDEDEGDGGEHALEVHHRRHRVQRLHRRRLHAAVGAVVDRRRQRGAADEEALVQRRPRLPPDREELLPERHVVRPGDPADPHGGEGVERHERRVHRPLLLHHAAVQHHQARHALQPHHRRRHQLPRVVALVQPVRHRRRRVPLVRQRHHRRRRRHLRRR